MRTIAVVIAAIVLITTGCYFESPNSGGLYASVPFFPQEHYYYCAAACVQMVARWAGINVSQDDLYAFMHGTIDDGILPDDLVRGAVTYCFSDAYWDQGLRTDNLYFARQISSVTNQIPVICITRTGEHTVVLYGGSWHMTVDANHHQNYYWDDVYVHDPELGGGQYYQAGAWQGQNCTEFGYVCAQVISNSAATAGPKTLADYNPTIYVTGGDGSAHGGGGPYDY